MTCGYGAEAVLRDVSFAVGRGEIVAILGASGSGKTTLLRAMIGLLRPTQGDVLIKQKSIVRATPSERPAIQRGFGVLYQGSALFGSMTVAENVAIVLREHSTLTARAIDRLVRLKLKMVQLSGYEHYYPQDLSGGMKKRAALARAMALDPDILFFDEPTGGLDPVTAVEIEQMLVQFNRSLGTTMLIVTHELATIFAIAQRILMIDKETRTIVAEGDPHLLKKTSDSAYVRQFLNRGGA